MLRSLLACAVMLGTPVLADDAEDLFVEANIIGILYHEMGHAIIDQMNVPIFGQEEDAADVLSIFLIDALWEPEAALDLAYDASFGFAAEAMKGSDDGHEIAYWDTHGPDEQRFYNTVCIFYGGDPEGRDDFAADMELPEDRAEYCPEEYDQAAAAWSPVLDEMSELTGAKLAFDGDEASFMGRVLAAEVSDLNEMFSWPQNMPVRIDTCGEPNAFYDPQAVEMVMCEEFEPHLRELFALVSEG